MDSHDHPLHPHYQRLWAQAAPLVREGRVTCDAQVAHKEQDRRRGVTIIARPAPAVTAQMGQMLARLAGLEPEQYVYPRADIHLTVLSLFSATEDYAPHLRRLDDYRAAVAAALDGMPAFAVDAAGVTLSTGAVLAQGYPQDGTLERIRDRLRAALTEAGLDGALDQRYRLVTAHSTLLRFITPLQAPDAFVDALERERTTVFGRSLVTELDLVINDWTMSSNRLTRVARFPLAKRVDGSR